MASIYHPKTFLGILSSSLVDLCLIGHIATTAILPPFLSKLYKDGNKAEINLLCSSSSTKSSIIFACLFLVFVLFSISIDLEKIGVFFFPSVFWLLSLGGLINVISGPCGFLLNMTNHEKYANAALMLSVATNLILNLVCLPLFGVIGAAIATAVAMITSNLIMVALCYLRLNLSTTFLFSVEQ